MEELNDWTCAEVRTKFGTSPLLFHAWACLINRSGLEALTSAIAKDGLVFWNEFIKFESNPAAYDHYPPGSRARRTRER